MRTQQLLIALALGLGLTPALLWLLGDGLPIVHAADFTVNVTNDENDGSCAPGDCSLREAIVTANGNGRTDTITLGNGT
jgi:CSLREA domain-containing protein